MLTRFPEKARKLVAGPSAPTWFLAEVSPAGQRCRVGMPGAAAGAGSEQALPRLEQVRRQIHFGSCVHPKIGPGQQRGNADRKLRLAPRWQTSALPGTVPSPGKGP